jgi:hypothetical protein
MVLAKTKTPVFIVACDDLAISASFLDGAIKAKNVPFEADKEKLLANQIEKRK